MPTDIVQRAHETLTGLLVHASGSDAEALQRAIAALPPETTSTVSELRLWIADKVAMFQRDLRDNVALGKEVIEAFRYIETAYHLDGQRYSSPRDVQALSVGAMLATCTGADFCSIDNLLVLWCQGPAGLCLDSREDFVRQVFLKGDDALLVQSQKFAAVIRDVMARGDTSIFH